jgi:hypothetical protein
MSGWIRGTTGIPGVQLTEKSKQPASAAQPAVMLARI